MADLPSYTVTQPRPGVWTFRFPWSDCTATYTLMEAPPIGQRGVLITRRNGAVFWANPDWEPAATVVPLILADAWDKGLLTP